MQGTVIDGRYQVGKELGAGGVGRVYCAERLRVGRMVAIKFLNRAFSGEPDFVRRFEREALAMSRLYHAHCVALIDYGVHEGNPYLVMEYVPGRTLSELLSEGPMTPRRALGIMAQLLSTLAYFHRRNVVHRDLKGANIMVIDDERGGDFVKLLDFGMAKLLAGVGADINVTAQGKVVGTPGTMSPEQISELPIDGRSDIYSAGILLYEMVVGRRPFIGDSEIEVMKMHLYEDPTPPRQLLGEGAISRELHAVIMKALAKDRAKRYQSAEDMARALAATPEAETTASAPATAPPPAPAVEPRRRSWAIAGWLAAAALGGTLVAREMSTPAAAVETNPVSVTVGPSPEPVTVTVTPAVSSADERPKNPAAAVAVKPQPSPPPAEAEPPPPPPPGPRPAWADARDRAAELAESGAYRAAIAEIREIVKKAPAARADRVLLDSLIECFALPEGQEFIPYVVRTFGDVPQAVDALVAAVVEGRTWYVRHHSYLVIYELRLTYRADRVGMWLADFAQVRSCANKKRVFNHLESAPDLRARELLQELRAQARRREVDDTIHCLWSELGMSGEAPEPNSGS